MQAIHESATYADFAEWVGISPQAASDLGRRGVIAAGWSLQTMIRSYAGHLRGVAAGRAGNGDTDLSGARAGLARAQREARELLNAELRGELVRKAVVEREIAGRLIALREALETLGDRLGPLLAAEDDPVACRHLVLGEVRQSLAALAQALAAEPAAGAAHA